MDKHRHQWTEYSLLSYKCICGALRCKKWTLTLNGIELCDNDAQLDNNDFRCEEHKIPQKLCLPGLVFFDETNKIIENIDEF